MQGVRAGAGVVVGFGLVLAALGGVAWLRSEAILSRTFPVADVPTPEVTMDPASIARGRHLVEAVLVCGACHGDDLGGAWMEGHPMVGRVWAPNLTVGSTTVATYGDADWARALRHGVSPEGRGLLWMPAQRWSTLSDDDLAATIAWLRAAPSVDRQAGQAELEAGGRVLVAMGGGVDAALVDPDAVPSTVPWGPTPDYGAYLARIAGCHDCHGGGAGAARVYDGPRAPAWAAERLTGWTGAQFSDAVVEGVGRDGRRLDAAMPSRAYRGMSDTEVDALWLHLRPEPVDDGSATSGR
ncbi:MAG: cytochrome c [Alphaproteobacteria bacterium]|nr:cytochrome c [Alphaproteobacteria bacterium]